jgi:glycosyltransferase involved in cell wall biosynthesis
MQLSMTRKKKPAEKLPELDEVLSRLESCEGLVREELERYRTVEWDTSGMAETEVLTSIVVPVYNEERTIARVITRLAALPFPKELIVVDDCSRDQTREVLKKLVGLPGVKIVFKEQNAGKGAALRTGFGQASGDLIVVQDADLEYDPADIPRVLEPLIRDEADVVFGSRFIGKEIQDKSIVHRLGNWMLTTASNLFTGIRLTDMETCYKAFRRDVLADLRLVQNRFGVEPEMTAKLARLGYRITEVPITYHARGYKDGKKIGVRDLFKAVYCIVRYGVAD